MKAVATIATIIALATTSAATAAEPQFARGSAAVEIFVESDPFSTWTELVDELSGRGYEVNALVQNTRNIKALFHTEVPSRYVDCGEITVRSKHAVFGERRYNFLAANSVRYLVVDELAEELVDVERRTSLNAIANIDLIPMGQGTRVRVDADYALNFRIREFGNNVETRKVDEILNFDSAAPASNLEQVRQGATTKPVNVECRATGALERAVVSVLGNAS